METRGIHDCYTSTIISEKIKKYEMRRACDRHGAEEIFILGFW
jgi:hypothetical protein